MGWWAGGRAIWANGRVALFSSKHVEVSNERIIQTCNIDLPSTRVDVSTTGGCSSLDSDSMMPSYRVELRIRILGIPGIARTS